MDDAAAAVEVKFITEPIPAPGGPHARYLGGRLTYYGAAEIIESTAVVPNVSVRRNDVVRVASSARAVNNHDNEPFLAQVRKITPHIFLGELFSCRQHHTAAAAAPALLVLFCRSAHRAVYVGKLRKEQAVPKPVDSRRRDTADLGQINSSERREKRPFRGVGRTAKGGVSPDHSWPVGDGACG